MIEDRNDYDQNDWEQPAPDIEDRLVGEFLGMFPTTEEFLNTAYDWEDERVNSPVIAHELLSHKEISIIVFLAESLQERISKLMSDLPGPVPFDEDYLDPEDDL
jgi:hypothetical protein